jgi:hypothetical protein
MNKIRTPRGPRTAQRQGLCHVSVVIQRLLARYGITLDESPAPVAAPTPTFPAGRPVANVTQQSFAWFNNDQLQNEVVQR